jgi:hypothetical protein
MSHRPGASSPEEVATRIAYREHSSRFLDGLWRLTERRPRTMSGSSRTSSTFAPVVPPRPQDPRRTVLIVPRAGF